MKLEKLETFVNQIENEEKKSVPELKIILDNLIEKINEPGNKDLDMYLRILDLKDRVCRLLNSLLSYQEVTDHIKMRIKEKLKGLKESK